MSICNFSRVWDTRYAHKQSHVKILFVVSHILLTETGRTLDKVGSGNIKNAQQTSVSTVRLTTSFIFEAPYISNGFRSSACVTCTSASGIPAMLSLFLRLRCLLAIVNASSSLLINIHHETTQNQRDELFPQYYVDLNGTVHACFGRIENTA